MSAALEPDTRADTPDAPDAQRTALRRRLAPLHVAVFLHALMLWVAVEKLLLAEIGFTPMTIGIVAAAYAGFVPLVEVACGVLADRWSRRGVLMLSGVALTLCALLGALAHDVLTYAFSAVALGFYYAMYTGTLEAVVYDTVLEETGRGADFERAMGRARATEGLALVVSSLLGGMVAEVASARAAYWLSVPFAAVSVLAWLRFREPTLHQGGARLTLRGQLTTTYRAVAHHGRLRLVAALVMLTAVTMQLVFEFGPVWLVALSVPAALYGPYWAALVGSLGVGGLVVSALCLDRPHRLRGVAVAAVALSVLPNVTSVTALVMLGQIGLTVLMVAVSLHVTRLLHDQVTSQVRTGVASGLGALTWLAFVPVALAFGFASEGYGVARAGWLITVVTVAVAALLACLARRVPG